MITAFLLLPVLCILAWLYWYLLPQRAWRPVDSVILGSVLTATGLFIGLVETYEFTDAGPIWSQIVSATGAYAILAAGLGVGLAWRRRRQ